MFRIDFLIIRLVRGGRRASKRNGADTGPPGLGELTWRAGIRKQTGLTLRHFRRCSSGARRMNQDNPVSHLWEAPTRDATTGHAQLARRAARQEAFMEGRQQGTSRTPRAAAPTCSDSPSASTSHESFSSCASHRLVQLRTIPEEDELPGRPPKRFENIDDGPHVLPDGKFGDG